MLSFDPSETDIEDLVFDALERLPLPFREQLGSVAIVVEDEATPDQLASVGARGLYGLYQGIPRTAWGADQVQMPSKITIFRGPLVRANPTPERLAAADVVESLGQLVSGVGEITRRLTPLYVVASGAAASDPEVAEVVDRHERWRVEGYRRMLDVLRTKSALLAGLTPERANDLLLLYVGMDVYHALVEVAGWSHDEWAVWTRATLAHQLFAVEIDDR